MRTRTRNTAIRMVNIPSGTLRTFSNVYCNGSVATTVIGRSALNQVSAERSERISDDLGKGRSNACIHRSSTIDLNDSLTEEAYGISSPSIGVQSCNIPHAWYDGDIQYIRTLLNWNVSSDTGVPPRWSVTGSADEALVRSNLIERAKQLKADVLLNIVEANQIWPSINSLSRSLPNMAYHWWELRKVLRTASGAFLAWKFGVSPILSDLMNIARYMPKIDQDLIRHKNGDKTRFSSLLGMNCVHVDAPYASGTRNGYLAHKFWAQGRMTSTPGVRYVLVVKPTVKYQTAFFQKASLLMSRFASSPASLAWELVPFSFVVDWFVDLRSTLNTLDSALGSSPYAVESFTRSFSYGLAEDHFIETYSPCNGALVQSFRSATYECKHYERSNVSGSQLVSWNPRFGKNQAAISAALITQALLKIPGAMRF